MRRPELHIAPATHEAARYACERWHYAGRPPLGRLVRYGVWEGGRFVGVVIFSHGATPHIGSPYGMTQLEVCELTRVALTDHAWPVSRILSIALRLLKRDNPGLRLVVSFADADEEHHGGIYQAANWIYTGLQNAGTVCAFIVHGRRVHKRTFGGQFGGPAGVQSIAWVRENVDPNAEEFVTKGKHKYLWPLDAETRALVEPLAQPYPSPVAEAAR